MRIHSLTVGSMAVCCYIVACEETGKGIIIDPGGNEAEILARCTDEQVKVEYIVNTHGHPDHVCGNARIKAATGAAIVMHAADAEFFARSEVQQYFSMLGLEASPPVDQTVKDNDLITFGNQVLRVLHTPGHTPGGICLYQAPNLFTGDTLFVGGLGRSDFPGGDTTALMRSIHERLLTLPDDTVVWPGHGYGGSHSTIGMERRANPYLNESW